MKTLVLATIAIARYHLGRWHYDLAHRVAPPRYSVVHNCDFRGSYDGNIITIDAGYAEIRGCNFQVTVREKPLLIGDGWQEQHAD